MNKKTQLGAAVLGVIITTALVSGAVSASSKWGGENKKGHGQNQGVMHEAIEAGDYNLLGGEPRISEDQFNKFLERYNENDFKVTNELVKTVLSLPIHTELEEDQLKYITKTVLDFLK